MTITRQGMISNVVIEKAAAWEKADTGLRLGIDTWLSQILGTVLAI